MKYKVIGISGFAQSGKDTCANRIMKFLGYEKASFADPLKLMLMEGLGLTKEQLWGDQKEVVDERYGKTPRYLMQTLGTEWGKDTIGKNIWINAMDKLINESECNYIIPDVRFEEEAKFIRNNGIMIHVDGYKDRKIPHSHRSESGVKRILSDSISNSDIIINNTGTLKAYYAMIDEVIAKKLY